MLCLIPFIGWRARTVQHQDDVHAEASVFKTKHLGNRIHTTLLIVSVTY